MFTFCFLSTILFEFLLAFCHFRKQDVVEVSWRTLWSDHPRCQAKQNEIWHIANLADSLWIRNLSPPKGLYYGKNLRLAAEKKRQSRREDWVLQYMAHTEKILFPVKDYLRWDIQRYIWKMISKLNYLYIKYKHIPFWESFNLSDIYL